MFRDNSTFQRGIRWILLFVKSILKDEFGWFFLTGPACQVGGKSQQKYLLDVGYRPLKMSTRKVRNGQMADPKWSIKFWRTQMKQVKSSWFSLILILPKEIVMKFRKIQRTNNFITLNHTKPHFSRSGSRMGFPFPFRKACFRLGGSLDLEPAYRKFPRLAQ